MRLLSQRWRSDGSMKICCCYCMIDVLLAIFVGLLCWLLFSGFVPPYKRGFYCSDQSIRLPYKPNTVSVKLLLFISISVPILLVVWYNAWTFLIVPSNGQSSSDSNKNNGNPASADRFRLFFATGTSICVEYFFGLMVVVALMHFGKSAFGVLRPHFIDVCRPNVSLLSCADLQKLSFDQGGQRNRLDADDAKFGRADDLTKKIAYQVDQIYIEEAYCTTKDHFQLKVARESFPSGHTAVSVYALLFVLCFIRDRSRRLGTVATSSGISASVFCPPLLRYGFTAIFFSWTAFVCVTRITDHWHHWTDVVGGVVLGVGVGAALFFRKDSAFRNSLTQGKAVDY